MLKRLRAIVGAALIAGSALFVFAAPAMAGTQGTACPITDSNKVLMYENTSTDHSDGDDRLWQCGNNSTYDDNSHTLSGMCKSAALLKTQDDWNDCISSAQVWLSGTMNLCVYTQDGYTGVNEQRIAGPQAGTRINFQLGLADYVSSHRFVEDGTSC